MVLPAGQILGPVYQHQPFPCYIPGAQHHVIPVCAPDHLGIPHMPAHIRRIVPVRQQQFFFRKMETIPARHVDRVAAAAGENIIVVVPVEIFHISGVKIVDQPVFHESGAGVHAVGVKILVRVHRGFTLLVMHKIPRGAMAPQLQFSGGFKGRVLVVNVVSSVHLAQPVGVVEPPGFRHQVVGQTVLIRRHLLPVRLILPMPLFIHFPVYLLIFLHNQFLPPLFTSDFYCPVVHSAALRGEYLHPERRSLRENHHGLRV